MTATVWTIGALLRWTAGHFVQKGITSPRLDAEVLLAHALGCRRIDLYVRSEELADDELRARFKGLIEKRIQGWPVAYLVGSKEFYLRTFAVSPEVLIPRPATETLVMTAIERLKVLETPRVLEIGTGSGCVAVSLAAHLPSARLVATDRSGEAIEVARSNASAHGVTDRIEFRIGDLWEPVGGATFEAVVCNPPYIPTGAIARLAADVREYEPRAALDGGPDGLTIIRRLVAGAAGHLTPGGWLLFEFGAGQEAAVEQLVREREGLAMDSIVADWDGVPRVAVSSRGAC
jgi:release factor glutamine methyltransferase